MLDTVTSLNDEHLLNARHFISFTEGGITTEVNIASSSKACSSISVMVFPKSMFFSFPHSANAIGPITSTPSHIFKSSSSSLCQNAIFDTLLSVPRAFPALMRAGKVQKRASKVGFDWSEVDGPLSKVEEETAELKSAIAKGNAEETFEEFGDLLFAAVNVSRFIGVNAEEALSFATDKFINRFARVEELAVKRGIDMKTASLETLDKLGDEVKTVFKR